MIYGLFPPDAPGRNNSRPITGSGALIRQPHHAQFGFQMEEEQIDEAIARSLVGSDVNNR